MNAKDYFKLTAKMLDRQKEYFRTRADDKKKESMALEEVVMGEVIRVAMLDEEAHKFVSENCPEIAARLKMAEVKQQIELKFG